MDTTASSKGIVMVVEDDPFLRKLLVEKFGGEGFTVAEATNGAEVWAYLKNQIPNIILLDLMMPDTDGFQVLEQLRAQPATKDVPVLVLSNLGGKENIDRAMSLGANDYAIKAHFVLDEIVAKVSQLMAK